MNKPRFYSHVRATLFGGKMTQTQVDGIESILDSCAEEHIDNIRFLAYILATVYHETGRTIEPVREGFAKTDEKAIEHVTAMFNKKQIAKNYALRAENGKSFFGRGYVQLTWDFNYKAMGKLLAIDLYNHPDLALTQDVAAKILIKGMQLGSFTGKKLKEYINDTETDYVNARRVVNGKDKASLIASYALKFEEALK